MPIRAILTSGIEADCKHAIPLIEDIEAEMLLGDKGYDTNEIVEYAMLNNMQVVIPPKNNRIEQREYDEYIYKLRHLVENAFRMLKEWRGIATRYAKTASGFLGAVIVRCIFVWLRLYN